MSGFGDYAQRYKSAGWHPIPLPHGRKGSPPTGYTGTNGRNASGPDIQAWIEDGHADGNIGLRITDNVVGIDVDDYDGKGGGQTLAELETELGPLPATWRSSSRPDDPVSGIRFFRVSASEGRYCQGYKGIEVIQHHHRYAVVPPSQHDKGGIYAWYDLSGQQAPGGAVPRVSDLGALPSAWIAHLEAGASSQSPITAPDAAPVVLTGGPMDDRVARALAEAIEATQGELGSRHDATRDQVALIVRLGEQGHTGTDRALAALKAVYVAAVGSSRAGADIEFDRMVTGAQDKVGKTPSKEYNTVAAAAAVGDMLDAIESPPAVSVPLGRSSWAPVDLQPVLDGKFDPTVPTMFTRSDGISLIYPGLTHSFHGEPESGKSLILQAETVVRIMAGELVLYLDFESSEDQVVQRLREFGASDDAILTGLTYVRPYEPFNAQSPAWLALLGTRYTLAVLDGVTEAMSLSGRELIDNGSVAHFLREIPDTIARTTGAAVAMIDHVKKDGATRGRGAIGGQHKLAGLSGASYTVEPISPIMPGKRGELSIRIGKDRVGQVRPHSGKWNSGDRTQEAARVVVDSTGERPVVIVNPPADVADGTTTRNLPEAEVIRRLISNLTGNKPQGVLSSTIAGRIKKSAPKTKAELAWLLEEGYLREEKAPHNGRLIFRVRDYGDDVE